MAASLMKSSLNVFASMDAAAMEAYFPSPFTKHVKGMSLYGLLRAGRGYAPGHGFFYDDVSQALSLASGQLFRVIEPWVVKVRREYYRCGVYRSGNASASGLVSTGLYGAGYVKTVKHVAKQLNFFQKLVLQLYNSILIGYY